MKQKFYKQIQNETGLTDLRLGIIKDHLDTAFNIGADLISWYQQCDELEDLPGLDEIVNQAKQDMFDIIKDDEIVEFPLKQKEANCMTCGGAIFCGVCEICG